MRRSAAVVVSVAIVAGAAWAALSGQWPWQRLESGPLPEEPLAPIIHTASDTLRPGEALGELFARHGIAGVDLLELVRIMGIDARRMRAGQVFRFEHQRDAPGAFAVSLRTTLDEEVRAVRAADAWAAERRAIRWSTRLVRLEGRIATSLYDAMSIAIADEPLTAGERIRLAWDIADVFAWQVDFTTDLQPEDDFAVVFEREESELGDVRIGRIVAGRLKVGGRPLEAFRFRGADGRDQFYDGRGESLRRAFLRAPLEFRRISSGFSRSRQHPVLGTWRRHQGVDYAADTGTPVRAAGDGTVAFVGWSGGYGRMVELRHRNGITTRYAHLSGFGRGLVPGARVLQGDVVGFVGASGLATGPHLHYEFRQGGVARDPRRVDTGSGEPVPAALAAEFQAERQRLQRLLQGLPLHTSVADGAD
jgi:hypothetical protein